MALWGKILEIQGEAVKQIPLYSHAFPFEVRHCLANWIEEQPWNSINPDNIQHLTYAQNMFQAFLTEINRSITDLANQGVHFLPLTYRLSSAAKYFQDLYTDNPLEMVRTIQNCMQMEKNLVLERPRTVGNAPHHHVDNQSYRSQFEILHSRTLEADNLLQQMQQEQEAFILSSQEGKKLSAQLKHHTSTYNSPHQQMNGGGDTSAQSSPNIHQINPGSSDAFAAEYSKLKHNKERLCKALENKTLEIAAKRMQLIDQLSRSQEYIRELMNVIINEQLTRWKIKQKLAGNGVAFDDNLTQIQKWCEQVSDIVWRNWKQIKRLAGYQNQLPFPDQNEIINKLNSTISSLLSSLVFDTFVIEKQPPQVLKTNTRFAASIRLLVGTKLNLHMSTPEVQAYIISESQAAQIKEHKEDNLPLPQLNHTSGEILNHVGTMEYDVNMDKLCVHFKNMQLKKIKRQEKKGSETVADEKFCIMFKSSFKIAGGDILFNVWVLSLPIVVIVHGNQEANAWASILWDNAFSDFNREPFKVWNEIPWTRMAEMLNYKFASLAGRGLSEQNLHYLGTKAFVSNNGSLGLLKCEGGNGFRYFGRPATIINKKKGVKFEDNCSPNITIAQFNKDHLQNRPFTFWQWFYHICVLVKEYLRPQWHDNTIMGFVSRNDAHHMLMKTSRYTFLLRFSDSTLGGVTIAWLDVNSALGAEKLDVWNLKPFTAKDFAIRSLADRIKDLAHLKILYPDIPKKLAFGQYYTNSEDDTTTLKDGYVGTVLVTTTSLPTENKKTHHLDMTSLVDSTQKSSPPSSTPFSDSENTNPFEDLWNSEAEDLLSNFDVENFNINLLSNNIVTGFVEEMDSLNP